MAGEEDDQSNSKPDRGFVSWMPGFEPGNTKRNYLVGLTYVILGPVGVAILFISAGRNWNRIGRFPRVIIAIIFAGILLFGVISAAPSSMERPTPLTPEEELNRWMDRHQNLEETAVSEYKSGIDYWNEEKYAAAMVDFEDSEESYENLEQRAFEKANNYESGSRGSFLFSELRLHYKARKFEARHSKEAAFEMSRGNTVDADAHLYLVYANREDATEHMQTLRDEMGWE